MSTAAAPGRLAYLDGLRGVAIGLVLGFHYFTCFQALVPWGGVWAGLAPFRWGHHGVDLFFAISGCVICLTLARCRHVGEFAWRRWARLWPTLLLCSGLSFAVLRSVPGPWVPRAVDFLPSLTMTDPMVWNRWVPGLQSGWIDVAYWSLFAEWRFYAIAALLWWAGPAAFHRRFALLSGVAVTGLIALSAAGALRQAEWLQWALAARHLPWFLAGLAAERQLAGAGRSAATLEIGRAHV